MTSPTPAGPGRVATAEAHAGFALALHRAVSAPEAGNTVCSPWSVASALAAVAAGADEHTRAEIAAALRPDGDPALLGQLADDARAVLARRIPEDESVVRMVNRLWVDDDRTPTAAFLAACEEWPATSVGQVPLAADPEHACTTVNADVAEATGNLIEQIVVPGMMTGDERALLVNTVYVLAAWQEAFEHSATTEQPFRTAGGPRPVPMMHGMRTAPYAAADGWEYLALPLWHDLRAEILLPDTDLTDREPDLDTSALAGLRAAASEHEVTLSIPRFRVDGTGGDAAGLKEPLRSIGVRRLFDPLAAPLPRVVAEEPLFVNEVAHRCVLRVDEQGVEGAAATAVLMASVAFRELPSVEVSVDRPFLLFVTHRGTGAVLFLARVSDP